MIARLFFNRCIRRAAGLGLLRGSLVALPACSDDEPDPGDQVGANPTLPEPAQYWFHRCMLRQSSAGNRVRRLGESSGLVVVAFLSIGTTQFALWTLTYPINQATRNWTVLPENWELLRRQLGIFARHRRLTQRLGVADAFRRHSAAG